MSRAPRLAPMLAGGNGIPPDPAAYQLEPKLDGQRVIAIVEGDDITLTNRRGGDITTTYPELRGLAGALGDHEAVLDGEVVSFDARGQTSFQRLQRRMHVKEPPNRLLADTPVTFVAFDALWLDGVTLVERAQHERRRFLEELELGGRAWQTVPVLDAAPDELLAACREIGLEGFMAKHREARYQPGRRSGAWWKIKCGRRRELVVGGWSPGQGSRSSSIGSLALGCFDVDRAEAERRGARQRLVYVGQAGSGLNEAMVGQLRQLFRQIETPTSPFVDVPAAPLRFVRPLLVVEVAYSEVTESGLLRQPSIKGLRTDVVADQVVLDAELASRVARRC
ncbi:MAG: DNA ligase [Actinomycetota bacterium]|nr:DNA ligase [Actinomycetota bacterium]